MQFLEADEDAVEDAAGAVLADQAVAGPGQLGGEPSQVSLIDIFQGRNVCGVVGFSGFVKDQAFCRKQRHLGVIGDGADLAVSRRKFMDAVRAEMADDLEAFLEDWAQDHSYDPRQGMGS